MEKRKRNRAVTITISLAGGTYSDIIKQDDLNKKKQSSLTGPELFKEVVKIADQIAGGVDNAKVINRPSYDDKEISARINAQNGLKRFDKSVFDHKKPELLKNSPQAMNSLKNLLDNGKMVKNLQGNPVSFGVDNLKGLQSAYEQASSANNNNGNDIQDETDETE